MTKDELRREMRMRLKNLGAAREEKSWAICDALAAHSAFAQSKRVALFSPLPSEPDLNALWQHAGRQFCYPRVAQEKIEFVEIAALEDLVEAPWNPWVREPAVTTDRIIAPAEIDLVLVPGLAFTRDGWRLGRGGGFYDRFLAELPARTVKLGVCFEVQIVEALPAEEYDQRVDAVVTESGCGPTR
jgi:5-formyltetrahydrofolate cyclo-ligase